MKKSVATQKKKRASYPAVYIVFAAASLYLAPAISNACGRYSSLFDLFFGTGGFHMEYAPWKWDYELIFCRNLKLTVFLAVFFLLVFFLAVLYAASTHDLMTGSEYGTADWGDPAAINRKFSSKHASANRIYSQKIRIGMDGKKTRINNNVLIDGGSGAGKTMFELKPNLYAADASAKYPGSFVVTDPDGGTLRETGKFLEAKGYRVRVINLIPGSMDQSDQINPLKYIRYEADVKKLADNIFANTQLKGSSSKDPYFDLAASGVLQSLIMLVWMEHERFGWDMTMNTVYDLTDKIDISEDGNGPIDSVFLDLKVRTAKERRGGEKHPAYRLFYKNMNGAADTRRSVLTTLTSRLTIFGYDDIQRILSDDTVDLASIGSGKADEEETVKTALFIATPDADDSFTAVIGMIYTLLFQELYYQADEVYGGELPVPVSVWMDEFANITLPDNFPRLLATMRKRLISVVIIIQNFAQLKEKYKDSWENLMGNCDTFIYLGGNEFSTYEQVSKMMGKKTIWKRSMSVTHSTTGSSSQSDDVLGRELMLPEEIRSMNNNFCIVMVRGQKPVYDHKYDTFSDPGYLRAKELGAYDREEARTLAEDIQVSILPEKGVDCIEIDISDPVLAVPELSELRAVVVSHKDQEAKRKKVDIADIPLINLLGRADFELSADALVEVNAGIADGLSDDEIKGYILEPTPESMRQKRLLLTAIRNRSMNLEPSGKNDNRADFTRGNGE